MRISEDVITSTATAHTARRVDGGWELSWLPGRVLDRNQAITGMALAVTVAREVLHADSRWWPVIDGWAAELGLCGPDAVVRACEAPLVDGGGA